MKNLIIKFEGFLKISNKYSIFIIVLLATVIWFFLWIFPFSIAVVNQNESEKVLSDFSDNSTIFQDFYSPFTINRISIKFATFKRKNDCYIGYELYSIEENYNGELNINQFPNKRQKISQNNISCDLLKDNKYFSLKLPEKFKLNGGRYLIVLKSGNCRIGNSVSPWFALSNNYELGEMFYQNKAIIGDLTFRVEANTTGYHLLRETFKSFKKIHNSNNMLFIFSLLIVSFCLFLLGIYFLVNIVKSRDRDQ